METKQKKGLKFQILCLALGLLPMLVTAITITAFADFQLKRNIKAGIEDELKVAACGVKEYFAYDVIANGDVDYEEYSDHEYVTSLEEDEVELTLFKGDTRLLTSIKNADGSYNEGTQASPEVFNTVKNGNDYTASDVMINGTAYMVYYEPIYDGNGEFWGMAFAGEKQAYINETTSNVIKNLIFIVVCDVLIIVIIIIFLARKSTKPIKRAVVSMGELAEGNLDAEFVNDSIIFEIGELISSGEMLKEKLGTIIGNAKDTAVNLGESVETVDGLSKNSADGAVQISQAVNELATTAQSMAETVQDANTSVIKMGDIIDTITDGVANMVKVSQVSYDANMKAVNAMDILQDASNKSAESIEAITGQILETSKAINEVSAAADAISSISEETNLLALNASIEAARAGEAGRGFAVVAENIKKLAEESNQSAGQIQEIINHITGLSEKSVTMANEVGAIVENQKAALADAYREMEATKTSGVELKEGVQEVGKSAEDLADIKESVLNNISDLSAISEENAASSEEVSASVENIASAVEGTTEASAVMKDLADKLSEQMAYFK